MRLQSLLMMTEHGPEHVCLRGTNQGLQPFPESFLVAFKAFTSDPPFPGPLRGILEAPQILSYKQEVIFFVLWRC